MQQIPNDKNLPIEKLAACFKNTTATYKFYWLLSIIEALEDGFKLQTTIFSKHDIFARMVSNAWYTVNYFHVSFGKLDNLQAAINAIKNTEGLTVDADKKEILKTLLQTENKKTKNILASLNNNVPHWFLSPWFPGEKNPKNIYIQSKKIPFYCPYILEKDFISVDILWANYFLLNTKVIKNFCYWNLALFLQSKNPNVPDIPNKLIKPALRFNNNKQRKFWDIVFDEKGSIDCIYTSQHLTKDDYALDHFVPYNFVSHDLMWNLIPADKSFNSSKSDKLPSMNKYFDSFFNLQQTAIKIVSEKEPRNKSLEDYLTILPELNNLKTDQTKNKFRDTIQPLITIAANNGFEYL